MSEGITPKLATKARGMGRSALALARFLNACGLRPAKRDFHTVQPRGGISDYSYALLVLCRPELSM